MDLNTVYETWLALKYYIDIHDQKDAADTLVNLLIDNNCEVDQIRDQFDGEKVVLSALKNYVSDHEESFEEEDEDLDDYDDEWN